ncbi:MAG: hypothetical protein R3E02_07650 [Blastomonas sp.]
MTVDRAYQCKKATAVMAFSMLVPESIGELTDHLAWMVLKAPRLYLGHMDPATYHESFDALKAGIELLCPKFGEPHCSNLLSMADEAKSLLDEAEASHDVEKLRQGSFRLQDIRNFLLQKGWKAS